MPRCERNFVQNFVYETESLDEILGSRIIFFDVLFSNISNLIDKTSKNQVDCQSQFYLSVNGILDQNIRHKNVC